MNTVNKPVNCLLAVTAVSALLLSVGCSKEPTEPTATPAPRSTPATPAPSASASDAETTSVKTMDEYRSEADQKITAANAESELSKLEQEINADR